MTLPNFTFGIFGEDATHCWSSVILFSIFLHQKIVKISLDIMMILSFNSREAEDSQGLIKLISQKQTDNAIVKGEKTNSSLQNTI